MKQNTKSKSKKQPRKQEKKQDIFAGILTAIMKILFMFIVVALMLVLTKRLYQLGYDIFGEKPGTGVEIEIEFEVAEGESAMTTAKRLKDKNLISSEVIFLLQKTLYEKDIIAGTHVLNSNMTTLEILDELSASPGRTDDN